MLRKCLNRNFSEASVVSSSVRTISYKSDEYQYLPKSKIPTLHFQPSLPRLPIPKLSKTCERYLKAQKPLRSNGEYSTVQKLVCDFEANNGDLQKELQYNDSMNKNTSYITKPWFEMYLKDRKPLPINYNPFLVFIDDPRPEYNAQLIRATNLLISSLRFMKSLRSNYLEPEVYHLNPKKSNTKLFRSVTGALPSSLSWYGAYLFKAFPLDMSQYENLFNTSRIPKKGIDTLFHDASAKHILVMKNGNMYKVDVIDESGNIYDPKTILSSLKWIMNDNKPHTEYPVGVLTTLNRDKWAEIREHVEAIGNSNILNIIDSSIFNMILDFEEPSRDYKVIIQRYLHSNGLSRWFDKSFSLIIQKDGLAGLNFEHSWGDGVAVLRYFTDIYEDSTKNPQVHPESSSKTEASSHLVNELDFILDDSAKEHILVAKDIFHNTYSSLGVEVYEFLEFGKQLCKKLNISPDSLMQLAFQIAHYKLNRKFVSTYESCSTAAFKHGRTETMRPCTMETKAATEAICSNNKPSKDTLLEMIKSCSLVHGNLIKEAAMGEGFDRHLFALHLLAQKRGSVPELFNHPLHHNLNHYVMSTSTLSSDIVMCGAFGPVVSDGFGIGYSIWNDRLGAIVSHYKGQTDGEGYIKCLESSLHDLYNILK